MRPSTAIDTLRQQMPYHKLRSGKREQVIPLDWPTEWERFDARELFNFDLTNIPAKKLETTTRKP